MRRSRGTPFAALVAACVLGGTTGWVLPNPGRPCATGGRGGHVVRAAAAAPQDGVAGPLGGLVRAAREVLGAPLAYLDEPKLTLIYELCEV